MSTGKVPLTLGPLTVTLDRGHVTAPDLRLTTESGELHGRLDTETLSALIKEVRQ